jgi:hypothetical protein
VQTQYKNAIHHEIMVEFSNTRALIGYFEMRKEDKLPPNILLYTSVPRISLEFIHTENDTFLGSQGEVSMAYFICSWRQFIKNYRMRFIFKNHFQGTGFLFDILCMTLNILCLQIVFSQSFKNIID